MGNWKDKENCILQLEIIMLDNLGSTKRKEEEYIIGLERKVTCMRDNLEMVFRVVTGCFLEKEDINSMKVIGIMECLMEKGFNFSRMVSDMRETLSRINSTETVCFIRMIQ